MNLSRNFCVVLVQPLYAGNVGAVARAMKNMGFSQLRLVAPKAKIKSRECLDRAIHSESIVKKAKIFDSLKEGVKDCPHVVGTSRKPRHSKVNVQFLNDYARECGKKRGRTALVFGPEDRGLSNEELMLCDRVIEIPASPKFSSLNLSHAVMVVLYEIFITDQRRGARPCSPTSVKPATAAQKEGLYDHLQEALLSINFLEAQNPERIMRDLRNILGRAELDQRELSILRGICRKILNLTSKK